MARDTKKAIDEILATLYANDVRGYLGVDSKVLTDEAKKRIQRTLSTLDPKSRKSLEDEANYRLAHFKEFSQLPKGERLSVVKEARMRDVSIEKAYEAAPQKEEKKSKRT